MKLIDVLVMISEGKLKEGAIIKYTNFDFILKFSDFELRTEDNDIYFCSCEEFNEEVEIIEHTCEHEWEVETIRNGVENTRIFRRCVKCGFRQEAKYTKNKIKELTWYDINTGKGFDSEVLDKLNEVIHYINKNGSEEKINIKPECDHNWIPTYCDWTGSYIYIECKCTKCGEIKNCRSDK